MDIDGNNALQIKAIGVVISTFETLPLQTRLRELDGVRITRVDGLRDDLRRRYRWDVIGPRRNGGRAAKGGRPCRHRLPDISERRVLHGG